jgi:glyoxylase-like metal-dependent hydrolase (beta-lactamase superfamily II)
VAPHDLHALLLTHIHFDHAGASGVLAQQHPQLTVYVHPAGAPHLADPRRLVASATRIYGSAMDRLWGPILPVPEPQLRLLADGDRLVLGDRALAVRHTPGHAVHHAAFLDEGTGIAYVGDTAGIRSPAAPVALPVTPPPDFDLEAWLASLDTLAAWQPAQLFLTHFGLVEHPAPHLAAIREGLVSWTAEVRRLLDTPTLSDRSARRASMRGCWTPCGSRCRRRTGSGWPPLPISGPGIMGSPATGAAVRD